MNGLWGRRCAWGTGRVLARRVAGAGDSLRSTRGPRAPQVPRVLVCYRPAQRGGGLGGGAEVTGLRGNGAHPPPGLPHSSLAGVSLTPAPPVSDSRVHLPACQVCQEGSQETAGHGLPRVAPVSAPHLQVALPAPPGPRSTARWSEQLPSAAATFLLHSPPWLGFPREEQASAAAQEELPLVPGILH